MLNQNNRWKVNIDNTMLNLNDKVEKKKKKKKIKKNKNF